MTWIGRKKIAFVPVFRTNTAPDPPDQIPADWNSDILRRVLFDPDRTTGADRSLRAYIHAASSGRADLGAVVKPMVVIDRKDVRPDDAFTHCDEAIGSARREYPLLLGGRYPTTRCSGSLRSGIAPVASRPLIESVRLKEMEVIL